MSAEKRLVSFKRLLSHLRERLRTRSRICPLGRLHNTGRPRPGCIGATNRR